MNKYKAFTLTELLIAAVLVGLIILTVTSVDITSRRFFNVVSRRAKVQDEAKIAMEHIVKNVQRGIGDVTNPGTSEGFSASGSQVEVQLDVDGDGRFTGIPPDKKIRYTYNGGKIVYDPDINIGGNEEDLTANMVTNASFNQGSAPNQVDVTIEVLHNPSEAEGLENPKTTLTSSIILRAMSCR